MVPKEARMVEVTDLNKTQLVSEPYQDVLQYFEHTHLPTVLAGVAADVRLLAHTMVAELPESPQLLQGLQKLLEAKDCFVRAALKADPDDLPIKT